MEHVNHMRITYKGGEFSLGHLMLQDLAMSLLYYDLIVNGTGF
jgi:hypothetical protein